MRSKLPQDTRGKSQRVLHFIIIIIIIRIQLFQPHWADQMPGHYEMGQVSEHRPLRDHKVHQWVAFPKPRSIQSCLIVTMLARLHTCIVAYAKQCIQPLCLHYEAFAISISSCTHPSCCCISYSTLQMTKLQLSTTTSDLPAN